MKVKILAQLKKQFPGVQNELLDRVASVLEKTVTKEEDIETAVSNSAGLVSEFSSYMQSEADRRVTAAVQKREAELKAEFEKKSGDSKPGDPKPGDVPEWAKSIIDANKALADELANVKTATTQKIISERLVSVLGEKKIPAKFYGKAIQGKTFKDEAEMLSFATEIETEFNELQQEFIDKGLIQQTSPVLGGVNKDGVSTAVQNFVESKKAELEGKAAPASSLGGKQL